MNRKSKIIVSVVGITIVLLALLGITYAYYLTRIEGNTNTNSISVSTADLKLKYDDGTSELVTKSDIMPGTKIVKDFKVINEGESRVNGYVVVLEDIDNTLTRHDDLIYKIECKLNDATSCGETQEVTYPYDRKLAVIFTNDIEVGVTHNYTLIVTYKNLIDIDQSEDMGKMFDGRINIMDANNINPYTLTDSSKNETSLAYNIINNARTNANGTTFRAAPLTKPAEERSVVYSGGINPKTYNTINYFETPVLNSYFVYSEDFIPNPNGYAKLVNPQIFHYTGDLSFLKGKYITSTRGYSSESIANTYMGEGSTFSNLYKVREETTSNMLYFHPGYFMYSEDYEINPTSGAVNLVAPKILTPSEDITKLKGKYLTRTTAYPTEERWYVNTYSSNQTLYYVGEETTNNTLYCESVIKEQKSVESTLSITNDSFGTAYYYRGGVTDNYLNFADMCWKIIYIAGDGSVKLILEDQYTTCEDDETTVTSVKYTGDWSIPTDVGSETRTSVYGYALYSSGNLTASDGTTNKDTMWLAQYINNTNTTSLSKSFKNFQSTFSQEEISKLKSGDWCYNDIPFSVSWNSGKYTISSLNEQQVYDNKIKGQQFYYDTYLRLIGSYGYNPTLKCNGRYLTTFEDDDVSPTPMYVATITADEYVFAGGGYNGPNKDMFLINDIFKSSRLSANHFSLLSLESFANTSDRPNVINNEGSLTWGTTHNPYMMRPSINLKPGIQISGGNGTRNTPYIISVS